MIKLYLNSCKIRLLQFFYFSLVAGTARRWLTNRYPLRRVGHPNERRSGEMRVLFVLRQPSAEMARVGWANMWCGEMRNFFARSSHLRDRAFRTPKHVAECEFLLGTGQPSSEIVQVGHPNMWQNANLVRPGAAPSHETRVNHQKLV